MRDRGIALASEAMTSCVVICLYLLPRIAICHLLRPSSLSLARHLELMNNVRGLNHWRLLYEVSDCMFADTAKDGRDGRNVKE